MFGFVCAEGLCLTSLSEGGPSHVACFVVVPLVALPARLFYKLYVMFIYDIVVLRLWRHVTGVCGSVI